MPDIFVIRYRDSEEYHDWNKYTCPYCKCEFIADGVLYTCPECSRMLTDETKKLHITNEEAHKILAQNITTRYHSEE